MIQWNPYSMEKQLRCNIIDGSDLLLVDVTLDEFVKKVKERVAVTKHNQGNKYKWDPSIRLQLNEDDEDRYTAFNIIIHRYETDQEFKDRRKMVDEQEKRNIIDKKKWAEENEKRERKLYKELKKKYG